MRRGAAAAHNPLLNEEGSWSFYIFIALVCGMAVLGHMEAQSSHLCLS
jgi:hypothetical protein